MRSGAQLSGDGGRLGSARVAGADRVGAAGDLHAQGVPGGKPVRQRAEIDVGRHGGPVRISPVVAQPLTVERDGGAGEGDVGVLKGEVVEAGIIRSGDAQVQGPVGAVDGAGLPGCPGRALSSPKLPPGYHDDTRSEL